MQESQYIKPRLGRGAIFILGLIFIAAITATAAYLRQVGTTTVVYESLARSQIRWLMWLTGMSYGLAAGAFWLATILKGRYLRWVVRAATVIVVAAAQQHLGTEGWLFSLSNLGGLVCCQCMLFHWLGVPNWTTGKRLLTSGEGLRKTQFGIGDIVTATTCIALLLAIAIRFQTAIDPLGYWLVFTLFWINGPLITGCVALLILNQQGLSVGLLALVALLVACGILGLAAAEWHAAGSDLAINASLYTRVVLSYVLTFVLFCVAAKTDIVVVTETEAELDI